MASYVQEFKKQWNKVQNEVVHEIGDAAKSSWNTVKGLVYDKEDKKETPTKEEKSVEQFESFDEQCFLIDNWDILRKESSKLSYEKLILLNGSSPKAVCHILATRKSLEPLFKMTTAQKALLVPRIRIYKIEYPTPDSPGIEKEFPFADHMSSKSVDNIMNGTAMRGTACGIKSFSFELIGKSFAEGGMAKADLKLYFQSPEAFYTSFGGNYADFINLFIPRAKTKATKDKLTGQILPEDRDWNPLYFVIKIIVGWAVPDFDETIMSAELLEAVKRSSVVLFMTMIKDNIHFKQTGEIEVDLSYSAYVEGVMTNVKSDLFYLSPAGQEAINIEEKMKTIATSAKNPNQKNEMLNIMKKDDLTIDMQNADVQAAIARVSVLKKRAEDKQSKYARILNRLMNDGSIFYTEIDNSHITGFTESQREQFQTGAKECSKKDNDAGNKDCKDWKVDDKEWQQIQRSTKLAGRRKSQLIINRLNLASKKDTAIGQSLQTIKDVNKVNQWNENGQTRVAKQSNEKVQEIIKNQNDAMNRNNINSNENQNKRKINFFFFGDLVNCAIKCLGGRMDTKNMRIMMGPMIFTDPRTGKRENINIAEIPISLNLFLTWYTNTVIAKNREQYLLKQFISDILRTLLIPALGDKCFNSQATFDVGSTVITLPGKDKGGEPIPLGSRIDVNTLNTFAEDGYREDFSNMFHYLFFYVTDSKDVESFTRGLLGNYMNNLERGIYHLYTGADRGLVKSIELERMDSPYMATMQVTAGSDKENLARSRYNAKIKMIGNCIFSPGMFIYFDTNAMGFGDVSKKIGFGGYYFITKVTTDYNSSGDFETILDCVFQDFGDKVDEARNSSGGKQVNPETFSVTNDVGPRINDK